MGISPSVVEEVKTEAEARELWCPYARAKASVDEACWPAINRESRPGKADLDCLCLASGCMLWRLVDRPMVTTGGDAALVRDEKGFCGLGSRP